MSYTHVWTYAAGAASESYVFITVLAILNLVLQLPHLLQVTTILRS